TMLRTSMAKTNALRAAAEVATPDVAPAEEGAGFDAKGMAKSLQKMMKDPAMKEMMRSQQKATINMMYGALLKEMTLSSEEKTRFVDLLSNSQADAAENAGALFDTDPTAKTNALEAMKEKEKQLEQDLR